MYVPELQPSLTQHVHNAILRAIDLGLGEQAFAEAVGYTEAVCLPEGSDPSTFIALTDLEKYIDWHRRRRGAG